nr:toprim domain-containing protein [Amaricoccus macauensis]
MLGTTIGGAVRLTDAPGGRLVVAEGIETALSLACGLLADHATICVAKLWLPEGVPRRLTIAADGDDAGRAAARRLAERASALGWSVDILPAPIGRDWNDIIMLRRPAG